MRDLIEDSIEIAANVDTVWALVCEPGWWINKGQLGRHRWEEEEPGRFIVHDEDLGAFTVGVVERDAPSRVVFLWQSGGADVPQTTVTFTLEQVSSAITRVHVVESGFAQMTDAQHDQHFRANATGWSAELVLLAAAAESGSRVRRP